jgi:hypothetical protein
MVRGACIEFLPEEPPRAEAWVHRMLAACFEEIPEICAATGADPG